MPIFGASLALCAVPLLSLVRASILHALAYSEALPGPTPRGNYGISVEYARRRLSGPESAGGSCV
jgi:hypothetical protein